MSLEANSGPVFDARVDIHVTPVSSAEDNQLTAAPGSPKVKHAGPLQQLLQSEDTANIPSSTTQSSESAALNQAENLPAEQNFNGDLQPSDSMDTNAVTAADLAANADAQSMDLDADFGPAAFALHHAADDAPPLSLPALNSTLGGTAVVRMAESLQQAERQASHQLVLDMQDLMQHNGQEGQIQQQPSRSASVADPSSDYSGPSSGASADTILDPAAFTEQDAMPSEPAAGGSRQAYLLDAALDAQIRKCFQALGEPAVATADFDEVIRTHGACLTGGEEELQEDDQPKAVLALMLKSWQTYRHDLVSSVLNCSIYLPGFNDPQEHRQVAERIWNTLSSAVPVRSNLERRFADTLRSKALVMYCKLHIHDPYVTHEPHRLQALADYTGLSEAQVKQFISNYRRPGRARDRDRKQVIRTFYRHKFRMYGLFVLAALRWRKLAACPAAFEPLQLRNQSSMDIDPNDTIMLMDQYYAET